MGAAAVIAVRRKRLIRRFREAGATDAMRAVTLDAIGERRSWIFNQMVRRGVFLPVSDGRYFMDERAADAFLERQRVHAFVIGGVLALVFLILWACGLVGP